MSERHVSKMLRQMAGGETVVIDLASTTKKLARLACIAEQFGYRYADIRKGDRYVMLIVPDHSPEARARAARNWAQYPNAGDGGALPPLAPDAIELLTARISFDITAMHTPKQLLAHTCLAGVPLAAGIAFALETASPPLSSPLLPGPR
ncbi:hypothetical protein [Streptomyces sp. NPDC002328]|uniref:hypothetical protein n=1 Tax=Streptomyces sp. NPDC002328 TaxID=3364642 RepID=UPI0036D015AE